MHRRIVFINALVCTWSLPLGAQDVYQLEPQTVRGKIEAPSAQLEAPSETGSRLGITLKQTPASVEILPGEVMRERGDLSAQEAVSRATGITAAGSPGDGSSALVARGFYGPNSVMQLYESTRLYVAAGTITFPVDTWLLDRVEVLRGPASVLYGEGAIGGVINYVPRQPDRKVGSIDLLAAIGRFDTYRLGAAASGPISDRAAYQIAAIGTKSNGFVERGHSERVSLASSLLFDVSSDLTLKFALDGTVNEPERYFGTPLMNGAINDRLRRQNYNVENGIIRYEDYWARASAHWRLSPTVSLRNEIYSLSADRHWRNAEFYELLPATSEVFRADYIEIFHDLHQLGNRLDLSVKDSLFGHANRFVVGFDWNKMRFQRTSNTPFGGDSTVAAFNFDPGLFVNVDPTVPEFKSDTTQYSLFAENYFEATAKLKLLAGVRFEKIDFKRESLVSGATFDKSFDPVTWRVGSVYDVTPITSVYGHISSAVEPLASLLTLPANRQQFDLTQARQLELGIKQGFLDGRAEATFALYDIVKEDLLTRDSADPTILLQVGEQSSRGAEAALRWAITRTVSIDANVALLRAQFDKLTENVAGSAVSRKGKQPPNVPERAANLWLTHSPHAEWRWGVGARYVGKRYANTANTVDIPPYTVIDAFVSYAPKPSLTLSLRGRNLGDRDYAIVSYSDTQFILGEPRAFELVAEARF